MLRLAAPQALGAAPPLWPILLMAVGLLRGQHRQKHETESDLRATVPVTLAGLFAVALGSEAFVDHFVKDPFVSPAPAMSVCAIRVYSMPPRLSAP